MPLLNPNDSYEARAAVPHAFYQTSNTNAAAYTTEMNLVRNAHLSLLVVTGRLGCDGGVGVDLASLIGLAPHLVILHLPVTLDETALQERVPGSGRAVHGV